MEYRRLLGRILTEGVMTESQQGPRALTVVGAQMRFKLREGFPVITERNMAPKISEKLPVTIWKQAINELCAFMNGARTLNALERAGCFWWKDWATEEKCAKRGLPQGDLGPGSYGAAFHDFPTTHGPFNQFEDVLAEARTNPNLRTFFITPWIPQFIGRRPGKQQRVVVAPCHGWIHFRIIEEKLTLHMMQRSGDVPVGVPSNMIQYAALTMMLAHVLGYEPYEYVHTISDAHIYEDQLPAVRLMLNRESRPLPLMELVDPPSSLFDFTSDHFVLSHYNPHPGIAGIPVAI